MERWLMLIPNRYRVVAKPFDIPIIRDIAVAVKKDAALSTTKKYSPGIF